MKPLYLEEISNPTLMKNLLSQTLHEMLKIKGEYTVVPFSYPGWPTADYISKLSNEVSKVMYDEGMSLAKTKFKNFNPSKTKLTLEMLDEIWMEATQKITEEIWSGFETEPLNRIPGLQESIERGAIIPRNRNEGTEEDMKSARDIIKQRAEENDYRDELLRRFREKYFTYMREHFDMFSEQGKEFHGEFKSGPR